MEWRNDEVVGTAYGLSANGWVDSELFKGWLSEHFIAHAVGARPLLLLLDGHSSHYQPELISYAREFGIIIFCLPPHTTHESQPLDASVFKSLKQNWQNACHNFIQSNPSLAITKYRFSGLFNAAWGKTMNPTTICSGFRRCGVYPLNPDAIDCSVSVVKPEASLQQLNREADSQDDGTSNVQQLNDAQSSSTSPEKAALLQRRFEEGYDLPDDEYIKWLHHAHPESIINQTASAIENDILNKMDGGAQIMPEKSLLFQRRFEEEYDLPDEEYMEWLHENHPESRTECFVSSNDGSERSPLSIADAFSDLPIASPLSMTSESLTKAGHDAEVSSNIVEHGGDKSNQSSTAGEPELKDTESAFTRNSNLLNGINPVVENDKSPEEEISSQRLSKGKGDDVIACSSSSTKVTAAKNNKENDKLRYISKYLVQFVPDAKPRNKETAVRISGARGLTSDKCAAILKEREEKIKKQQEEKERRKLEREQKRKEKEEQQKKKKAIAAEKKALAAAKKAEKEAKKAKVSKNQEGNKVNRKRRCNDDGYETRKKLQKSAEGDVATSSRVATVDAENVCCVCFQLYQGDDEDTDWIQCACGRWLHEDCIDEDDIIQDIYDRELFCPCCAV